MNRLSGIIKLSKRQRFVLATFLLTGTFVAVEFFTGTRFIIGALVVSFLTIIFLYLILRRDIKGTFHYPIFILPFLYSFSFIFFYTLVPARLIARFVLTLVYAFGLYSLFLTENIFAVSTIRTINLLRSARIVSFVISIFILFFLINFIFSLHLPVFLSPLLVFVVSFTMNFQSLWTYTLEKNYISEILLYSFLTSFMLAELATILIMWPVNASIYSIFLTGIFYTYSGLSHAWVEKRLFKGILWEYVWVGFLSILVLFVFAKWGI